MKHQVVNIAAAERSELERLIATAEERERLAMNAAAKAHRLEAAIALHRRRKTDAAAPGDALTDSEIDAQLWQELEPTPDIALDSPLGPFAQGT